MKIAFVLDDTLDSADGVQQYVLLIGSWLIKAGHEVHYICGESKRTDRKVHSLAKNIKVSFNKNVLSVPLPANSKVIRRLLNEEQFDVLHIQMPYSPFLAGKVIVNAPSHTALIATFHIAPHSKMVSAATKALAKLQVKTSHQLQNIVSVSRVAQDFLKRSYNLDSQIIPNAIDIRKWRSKKQPKKTIDIFFIGRLVERKGCKYLLEACRLLIQENDYKNIRIVIAGDGKQRQSLERFVRSNGLAQNVEFLGFVSEQQKQKLLSKSRLTVLPATGGESFGIVLLEAMAAGSVVLAGNNPGYTSVLETAPASLVEATSPKSISDKINNLLDDEQAYELLQKRQQEIVNQYDIELVGSAILKLYEKSTQAALTH